MSISLRKSMLVTYDICPKRFEAIWIKKMKSPAWPRQREGTLLHKFSYDFYEELNTDRLLANGEKYIMSFVDGDWETPRLAELVRKFCKVEATRWNSLQKKTDPLEFFLPYATEVKINVPSKLIEGTIDRIHLLENGKLAAFEIKSGFYWNKRTLRRELAFYDNLLNEYAAIIREDNPGFMLAKTNPKFEWIGAWNVELEIWFVEKVHTLTWKALWRAMDRVREAVRTGVFKKKISGMCTRCPISDECLFEEFCATSKEVG